MLEALYRRPAPSLLGAVVVAVLGLTACTGADHSRMQNSAQGASTVRPETASGAAPSETLPSDTAARSIAHATPSPESTSASARRTSTASIDSGARQTGHAPAPAAKRQTTRATDSATAKAQVGAAQGESLKFDAKTNTVTFQLIAGPFTFNGYSSGGATLAVPAKSNVVINFSQDDGTPHSAEIDSGDGPVPNSGGNPAIPRAYTNKVIEGLPQGATDVIRFTAPDSGSFRVICGVPGHALSGMWIWFKIDPAAKQPSFGASK